MVHVDSKEWGERWSAPFHRLVFNHERTGERVTGAFISLDDGGKPFAFVTYIEMDDETVYLQFGGVLSTRRGTVKTYRRFMSFLSDMKKRYTFIKTKVERTNRTYLTMALRAGFIISGLEFNNKEPLVLLEMRGK